MLLLFCFLFSSEFWFWTRFVITKFIEQATSNCLIAGISQLSVCLASSYWFRQLLKLVYNQKLSLFHILLHQLKHKFKQTIYFIQNGQCMGIALLALSIYSSFMYCLTNWHHLFGVFRYCPHWYKFWWLEGWTPSGPTGGVWPYLPDFQASKVNWPLFSLSTDFSFSPSVRWR